MDARLEARGVSKSFGHVNALENVDMAVRAGEVLALVGDNGAGKSTLARILTGVQRPDNGALVLDGTPVRFRSARDAHRAGVAAVHQDLAVVECLDIASNMFLGNLPRRGPFVDRRRMIQETRELLDSMNLTVHEPQTPLGLLPRGHRQAIAVARAVRLDPSVVIMDEPTAALGVAEKEQAVRTMEKLRADGTAVVLISHDLDVVFDLADRIQVLRLGGVAGCRERAATSREEIVGMITGAIQ